MTDLYGSWQAFRIEWKPAPYNPREPSVIKIGKLIPIDRDTLESGGDD